MANIKIAELQSSLLEKVSATDLETVHGGVTPPPTPAPGIQVTGSTSGVGLGFANGGRTFTATQSDSFLDGTLGAFVVRFGTLSRGETAPN
ncbi:MULTISPECIES: hypothetical protein [unclassified Nostoc]|uniref:hypothetical protein n=1 Tax=unclassified Nostoc TaxID=2593658 RepID=UPI002AD3065A|nr:MULTISPECIES: hypothetical protein [unclassified Nostoc]MDZ8035754.1 hypothetical protein [Nostoc sp. DedSLP04]MDZ8215679.1 hypothetical protein [Nostoc sp. ChiSLP03a]